MQSIQTLSICGWFLWHLIWVHLLGFLGSSPQRIVTGKVRYNLVWVDELFLAISSWWRMTMLSIILYKTGKHNESRGNLVLFLSFFKKNNWQCSWNVDGIWQLFIVDWKICRGFNLHNLENVLLTSCCSRNRQERLIRFLVFLHRWLKVTVVGGGGA